MVNIKIRLQKDHPLVIVAKILQFHDTTKYFGIYYHSTYKDYILYT